MIDKNNCNRLIKQYYKEIYNYCYSRLNYDKSGAEDCTQEVFVTFFSKHDKLEETSNIRLWLYRAADNVLHAYFRKYDPSAVSIEDSPEAQNIPDASTPPPDSGGDTLLDMLDDDERKIVEVYYDTEYGDRRSAAERLGLTMPALYQRIHKIKNKIRNVKSRQ